MQRRAGTMAGVPSVTWPAESPGTRSGFVVTSGGLICSHVVALQPRLEGSESRPQPAGDGDLPKLDICNGHVGTAPANATLGVPSAEVYHSHMTTEPPCTSGCFGPIDTIAECRGLYSDTERGCGNTTSIELADTFGGYFYIVDIDTVRAAASAAQRRPLSEAAERRCNTPSRS